MSVGTLLMIIVISGAVHSLMLSCSASRSIQRMEKQHRGKRCCACGCYIPLGEGVHINEYGIKGISCISCAVGITALGTLAETVGVEEADRLVSNKIAAMQILSGVECNGTVTE